MAAPRCAGRPWRPVPGRDGGGPGTHGLLPPPPPPLAQWETPFDPRDTFESRFHTSKRRAVRVPMMSAEDLEAPYFRDEELACTVVELSYTSNDSALFVLPDQGRMEQVEAMLLPETLRRWRASLQTRWLSPGHPSPPLPHSPCAPSLGLPPTRGSRSPGLGVQGGMTSPAADCVALG